MMSRLVGLLVWALLYSPPSQGAPIPFLSQLAGSTVPIIARSVQGVETIHAGTVLPPGNLLLASGTEAYNAASVTVRLPSGVLLEAAPLVRHNAERLVLFTLPRRLTPLRLPTSTSDVRTGETVMFAGFPMATTRGHFTQVVARGTVIGPGKVRALTNHGFAGAAVINSGGTVVGIVRSTTSSAQNDPDVIGPTAVRDALAQATAGRKAAARAAPLPSLARPRPQARGLGIVVAAPLSGPGGFIGRAMVEGAQLAMMEQGGGLQGATLRIVDDGDSPESVRRVAAAIAADYEVVLVVGHRSPGAAWTALPIYAGASLAFIAPSMTSPIITDAGFHNVFRILGRADLQGAAAAQYLAHVREPRRIRRVSAVYEVDTQGVGSTAHFVWEAERLGLGIDLVAPMRHGDDVDVLAQQLARAGSDVIFMGGRYVGSGPLLAAIRRAGVSALVVGEAGLDSSELLRVAGPAASNLHLVLSAGPGAFYGDARETVEAFVRTYGHPPGPFALQTYDAVGLGLHTIRQLMQRRSQPPGRSEVVDALRKTTFNGVTGRIEFLSTGDRRDASYYVVAVTARSASSWEANPLVRVVTP